MACVFLYDNEEEERLHSNAIKLLAEELDKPEKEIREIYEEILFSIKVGARIKDYLIVLVSRNVRDLIRRCSL
jgi:Protein of unknown function (DUF3562)